MGQKAKNLQRVIEKDTSIIIPKFLVLDASTTWKQSDIEKLIKKYNLKGERFAVRSSSENEDSVDASYAGLYKSFLNIKTSNLEAKVYDVSNSHKIDNNKYAKLSKPSVIIQEMVEAQKSGVLFTINPLNGVGQYVINSNFGLCSSVVDGEDCDQYVVNYTGHIVNKNIAPLKVGKFFEQEKAFDNQESLNQSNINELIILANKLKEIFKIELDIEFSFEQDKLILLQVRPISNLKEYNPILWDNSNIVESYDGITLPLTFSFIHKCYSNVYKEFASILGFNQEKILEYEHVFNSMIGINQGQVYYNLVSWYKLLMAFPGGEKNKKYMEQMMGVESSLPDYFNDEIKFNDKSFFQTITVSFKMLLLYLNFNKHYKKFDTIIKNEITNVTFDNQSLQQLYKFYVTKSQKIFTKWKAPLANDMYVMLFWGKTFKLYNSYNLSEKISIDEIMYQKNLFSMEPFKLLNSLAQDIKENEDLLNLFKKEQYDIIKNDKRFAAFNNKCLDYESKFGFRVSRELKLESKTLIEDESILFKRLQEQIKGELLTSDMEEINFTTLKTELGFKKALWFNFWLKRLKKHINMREKMRYDRTQVFGTVRMLFLEIAKRMKQDNIIDSQDDIFYLKVDEVLGLINGCAIDQDFKTIIKFRKKEYENYYILNNRIQSNGFINKETFYHNLNTKANTAIGISGGIYRGKVQIIEDISQEEILQDHIIVTKIIDPGWIIYFAQIKGLIIENGGMLSHSAIVARELKIPAIANYKNATQVLKNGQEIEINGQSGEIKIL